MNHLMFNTQQQQQQQEEGQEGVMMKEHMVEPVGAGWGSRSSRSENGRGMPNCKPLNSQSFCSCHTLHVSVVRCRSPV